MHRRGALSRRRPPKETSSARSACGAVVSRPRVREDDGKDCEQDAHERPKHTYRARVDVAAIAAIYRPAVLTGTASFELEPPDEAEVLRRFKAIVAGGYPYFVAEIDGRVAVNLLDLTCLACATPRGSCWRAASRPTPGSASCSCSRDRQVLLCCSRQAGKSTVVGALALHTAPFTPGALVLLLSPSQRQSAEIFRKVLDGDDALGRPLPARLPHAAAAGTGQRLARPLPARTRGDHPLLRRRQPARHRRGRPRPRRPVPQRPAHARRQPGPAGRPVDAVRPARLVLPGVGRRGAVETRADHLARLPAHRAAIHRGRTPPACSATPWWKPIMPALEAA